MYKLVLNDAQAIDILCKATEGAFALYFLKYCQTGREIEIIQDYCKKNSFNYTIKNYKYKRGLRK